MKKVTLIAIAIILAIAFTIYAAGETVQFSKFKFQPEQTYEITIHMNTNITSSMGIGTSQDNVQQESQSGSSLEQDASFQIMLQTFSATPENIIPIKMTFNEATTTIKGEGEDTPKTIPESLLHGKEFRGELDEAGNIKVTENPLSNTTARPGSWNAFQVLNMIPDFPEGKRKIGEIFHDEINQNFGGLTSDSNDDSEKKPWKATYHIVKIEGDDAHIAAYIKSKTTEKVQGGGETITSIGSSGEVVYSMADNFTKYVGMIMVINTVVKKDTANGKSSNAGAIINKTDLVINVKLVGLNNQ